MEIKCPYCNNVPEIDIFDTIQGVKFLCRNKDNMNITHYGIFSINNFYKYFIGNKDIDKYMEKFKEEINNISENDKNTIPEIKYFIKFTKEFDELISTLYKTYTKFKNYFYKILLIKKLINKETDNIEEKGGIYYSHSDIINKMQETINYINNSIKIKEEFPKILSNNDINQKIDEIIKYEGNKNNFNLNEIKKDFEYKNSLNNNICIKKLIKFENDDNYKGLFLKLNEELAPADFIYVYQIKNVFSEFTTFFQIFDKKFNIIMTQFVIAEQLFQIMQLKDNCILLKTKKKAKIIKLDINNKTINIIQEIDSMSKFFIEALINNNEESLLLQTNENFCFYKNNKKGETIYKIKPEKFTTKIKGDELFLIDNYNFISLFRKDIRFYEIINIFNPEINSNQLNIKKIKRISTNYTFLSGIQFISEDKQKVIIGSSNHLFLLSIKYKEIVTIFSYYRIERSYSGLNNECYLCLSDWISGHKIIRQINIDKGGNLVFQGNNYFEKFDFYIKNGLLDLGNKMCYIEDKSKY